MKLNDEQMAAILKGIGQELQPEKAYSIDDLTTVLGLSKPTLYAEINAGRLKTYCVGKRRFATRKAVMEWQQAREQESA